MEDFDIMQEEGATPIAQPKIKEEAKEDPLVGQGLIKHQNDTNFHPNVSPGLIFDSSESRKSEEDSNYDDGQDSRRRLQAPVFELGDLNDKSRN